ncbi:MAG: methyltransferase domain-containing protein [Roseiarcus sp.]|jgi:SAM-dependent methyltransferase
MSAELELARGMRDEGRYRALITFISQQSESSMAASFQQQFYTEIGAGGFTRIDGTVAFYQRVNSLLKKEAVLLDYGAGRGAWHMEDSCEYRRSLRNFRSRTACVIGVDVDEAVMQNPTLDEAHVFNPNDRLPLSDASIDIIVSDFVFEHISDPAQTASELDRVLKPGGWLCARTPNRYGYIALSNLLAPEAIRKRVLNIAQPSRKEEDVFPAVYFMNSFRALLKWFPSARFEHFSYSWDAEPGYHANNKILFRSMKIVHYITPPSLRSTLMIFIRKRL